MTWRAGARREGGFDEASPVVIRDELEVKAPPARVWDELTSVERWARWHRGVGFAVLRGPLEPGTPLLWRVDGMRVSSILVEVEKGHRIGWTIRTLGGRGYQRWILESLPSGHTLVKLEESWNGFVVWFLRRTLRRTLERSRAEWLEGLQRESLSGGEGTG